MVLILTKKIKNKIEKEIKHAHIDCEGDVDKWITLLFPDLNKEEKFKIKQFMWECVSLYVTNNDDDNEENDEES